ncbi:MAG: DUF1998 domain-containing protein [Sterolibacteriaceae bacterium]|uniref:DUF1998 domain-containing protein n=1 Tax=Candidatus Methylophosphatis roskildensis TaxID=2899263 RepID=A0A9D7HMM6_9PROT|nr:DUF1998 domain-containing protein [Candidatus Methylophosphatis roskildensis]
MSRPVRRSQAIAPFGIGALVDFPGPVSLIHAGLDAWPFDEAKREHWEFRVTDEKRLARRLNVEYFVQPPDFRQPERGQDAAQENLNLKLPFLRFPLWHVCPRCGRMYLSKYHDIAAPTCRGPVASGAAKGDHSSRRTVQVRFVAACKRGHLQDFPWFEWLFKHPHPDWEPDGVSRWLRMRSTGSASLTGVEIRAEERSADGGIRVVEKRTLAGAFADDPSSGSPTALSRLQIKCEGHNPVLAVGTNSVSPPPGCGHELYPLLRGASNLYFPQVVSSIYIPEIDDRNLSQDVLDLLDDHHLKTSLLRSAQESENGLITARAAKLALRDFFPEVAVDPSVLAEAANKHILKDILLGSSLVRRHLLQRIKSAPNKRLTMEIIDAAIKSCCPDWEIDSSLILPQLADALEGNSDDTDESEEVRQDPLIETDYRREEYQVFCQDIQEGYPKTNLLIRSHAIGDYGNLVKSSFERVSLLHKLRETRAFVGYSRIFPENDLTPDERWGLIASEKKRWLPAIIVRGEGIFLKFREDKLQRWLEANGSHQEGRLSPINHNLRELRERRHQKEKSISPKHVLIHTFAHLLINQLVYDCGYGSASLRERIYTADGKNQMSGVLIYTAAGDSEGTMGGLVNMGQPGYLDDTIAKALEKARWCSSDPVCIESLGQGPDNCNLGACHSCTLLPETSCEEQNRLLDRGMVVGTIQDPDAGYFSLLA